MPCDSAYDQVFGGSIDILRGIAVGLAGGSETYEDTGSENCGEVSTHDMAVVGVYTRFESEGLYPQFSVAAGHVQGKVEVEQIGGVVVGGGGCGSHDQYLAWFRLAEGELIFQQRGARNAEIAVGKDGHASVDPNPLTK